ncbi:MAG TPA: amidohydrolase family protein [Acidimicrobiales bacterium]|nr:amidohydrolase family protein [Acidimicrobiales bacterium]
MLDYVIRSATVVDGSGGPARRADVGVAGGRIVVVGDVEERGHEELDADGLLVGPGVVDPHTHYDAQLFWDPAASPSNLHGVTTVVGGNCGFTLAPLRAEDADYLRKMMAKVEGMPLAALEQGLPWDWSSFGEYLDRLEGRLGVNAGFLVGHCALRRRVLGAERAAEVADDGELEALRRLLAESIEAGGLGFSSSQSRTHSDGDNQPVTSRHADRREMLGLAEETGRHEGTSLEYITSGCLDAFSDEEVDLMVAMTVVAGRPLNWNLLTIDGRAPEKMAHQLEASSRAAEAGGRIVALTMPTLVPMNMSFRNHCALFLIPGWGDVMSLPVEERKIKLADPAVRRQLDDLAHAKEAGVFRRLAGWGTYQIGDTYAPANAGVAGRTVADIAAERGTPPFDTLLDVVIADDLRTVLWPTPADGDEASWELRATAWGDPRAMVGGSDAGAHLDRMCGANYPTAFLGDCLRGRRLVPVERAMAMLTSQPAALFGLRDRGLVKAGMWADLVVFDPERVDSSPARLVEDLPGGSPRLFADAVGVHRVIVNGVATVVDGEPTGELPGALLRSGRDTATPSAA